MKKTKILLLLLLLSAARFAFPQNPVSDIEISGNRHVSDQRILMMLRTQVGREFNEEVLRDDIRKVGETGFFSDIQYTTAETPAGIEISISVVENPVIRKITFTGHRRFRESRLRELLGISEGDIFNKSNLLKGLSEIEKKYRERRVHLVEVDYTAEETPEGEMLLNVLINEEGRSFVRKIIIEGNESFKAPELTGLMKIKRRRMPFIRGTFKQDIFQQDLDNIRKFYRDKGFLDAGVSGSVEADEDDRMLILNIDIREGRQYLLGTISFKGDLVFEENELLRTLQFTEEGRAFNRTRMDENLRLLNDFYMDKGYLRISINEIPERGATPETINVIYFVQPGKIYRAGEIIIRGNTKTKDKVLRREVIIEPGDKITSQRVRRSFNNLFDLNYFENINIYPELMEEEHTANVIVEVEEKRRTGLFLIGGGYSSVDDFIGMISIQQTNFDIANPPSFVGGGQNINFTTELGTEARNYRLSFTEPYFLDRPVWLGTDLYRTRRAWLDYTEEKTGLALRTGRRWEKMSLGFTMRTEEVGLSDIDIPSIEEQEGYRRKNSLTTALTHSSLDRRRAPTKGNIVRLSTEYAGGLFQGDVDFIKPVMENNFYRPFSRLIFHSRTYAGSIHEFGDTDVIPVYERFFGGGIGTVRGYRERSLGPRDGQTDDPVGGSAVFAQNIELIYPLYEDILKGVLFFDIGNVWEGWDDFGDLRKGVGAGVQVVVPLLNAPIEVYYGYALDRQKGERQGRVHIGMTFGF